MKRSDGQWPAQMPPDDFADRVLEASMAERFLPRIASVRPVEMPIARVPRRASVLRNAVVAWATAAAIAVGTTGLYFAKIRPEEQARRREEDTALAEAKAEAARKDRQIEFLTKQVNELLAVLDELKTETRASDLRTMVAERQMDELRAMLRSAPPPPAAAAPAKQCNCVPGDPLCSCP